MVLYALYVNRIGDSAKELLSRWSVPELRGATPQYLEDWLYKQLRYEEAEYDRDGLWAEEVTPGKPGDGLIVRIPFTSKMDAQRFLDLEPSHNSGTPAVGYEPGQIWFKVSPPKDAPPTINRVLENIDSRNRDIRNTEKRFREVLRGMGEAAIREAEASQAKAEQELRDIEELGIPIRRKTQTAAQETPPPEAPARVALRVIQDTARLEEALSVIAEMRRIARAAADSGALNEAGQAIVEDDLLPLVDELERLVSAKGETPAERTTLARRAILTAGRVQQAAKDTGQVVIEGAKVAAGAKVLADAATHLPELAKRIPDMVSWMT